MSDLCTYCGSDVSVCGERLCREPSEAEYVVRWEMRVRASSAHDAAIKALLAQRDPDRIATVFETVDAEGNRRLSEVLP
jgi:hypothetical protein